jgi:lipoprotein-releasing system ATP-binding protein
VNDQVQDEATILRVENLSHSFGQGEGAVKALRGVSFKARAGEVTAIVGPSGCGKSTMLYLLGLLDRPDSGEIYLSDKPMAMADDSTRTSLRNKSIGFVFQFHFLIKEFTARENVALPLRKGGKSPAEAHARADEFLKKLGLGDKAERFANKLSGGEQQRVAIARALANSPDLILADEPTGNLDVANSNRVFDLLLKFAREEGPAIILVTHNADLAKRCDRRLSMLDGKFMEQ